MSVSVSVCPDSAGEEGSGLKKEVGMKGDLSDMILSVYCFLFGIAIPKRGLYKNKKRKKERKS